MFTYIFSSSKLLYKYEECLPSWLFNEMNNPATVKILMKWRGSSDRPAPYSIQKIYLQKKQNEASERIG